MDNPVTDKLHTSDVIGTRNLWLLPANHQVPISGQSSSRITPRGPSETDARENKASNAQQGFKAPVSLPQKPGIGCGIGRFAGSHSALFPPGPQKIYYSRNSSISTQNTNTRSLPISSVPSSKPATTSTNLFKQWQSEERIVGDGVENSMKAAKVQNSSDSDSDGGVTLAMAQAAFLQGPGIVGLPLRPVVPKPNKIPQQQEQKSQGSESKELKSKQQKPQKKEVEIVKNLPRKTHPSLSSHMAAILQAPGAISFMPIRRSSSITSVSPSHSTPASVTSPVELEKNEAEVFGKELEISPVEALCTLPKTFLAPKESIGDKWADKYVDIDTRCSGTPITPFIYLYNTPQKSTVPEPITEKSGQSVPATAPRRFRQLRDGDIVGNEAPELPKENRGRRMMEKMGYKEGTPLGVNGAGGLEPVKVEMRVGNRGLGLSKEDLAEKARVEKVMRIEKASKIERELLERVAQTERVAKIHRASLEIAIQNHAAQLYQSAQDQIDLTQVGRIDTNSTRSFSTPIETSQEVIQQWQLKQIGLLGSAQFLKYTITTPWEIHKIRERISQIISHLDSSGILGVTDYNSILWSCMSRAVADLQQSRLGYLVDAELMKIARREFMQVVIGREKTGDGW